MKKLAAVLILLTLAVTTAFADTITAMATEPYMEVYKNYACHARIYGYDRETNMLEVELIVPEIFSHDDVRGLKAGDGIFTGGQEVIIRTITEEDGYVILNKGDYEFSEGSVWLMEDSDGNFRPVIYEDYTWNELARLEVPVTERLLFLDMINPSSGDPLSVPAVYNSEAFLGMKDEGPGLTVNNAFVVFDGNGDLAVIQRYYVPWQ